MKKTAIFTKENNAKIKALKKIPETKWDGTVIHPNLDAALVAINLDAKNSGLHKPCAIIISGLKGYYMLNHDGSIFCEARVIKDGLKFRIEYMSMHGWNEFEQLYEQILSE